MLTIGRFRFERTYPNNLCVNNDKDRNRTKNEKPKIVIENAWKKKNKYITVRQGDGTFLGVDREKFSLVPNIGLWY